MIGKFMSRFFGSSGDTDAGGVHASETYQGFEIRAAPVNEGGGWRVSGTIAKTIGDEEKTHHFVRADTCGDADSAAAVTLRKARQLIDERGDSIFD